MGEGSCGNRGMAEKRVKRWRGTGVFFYLFQWENRTRRSVLVAFRCLVPGLAAVAAAATAAVVISAGKDSDVNHFVRLDPRVHSPPTVAIVPVRHATDAL